MAPQDSKKYGLLPPDHPRIGIASCTSNGSNSERCVVCLVHLVSLVGLTQPNTRDRPDSGLRMLAACFYALIQNQYVTPPGASSLLDWLNAR